jgi:hypothetical protein
MAAANSNNSGPQKEPNVLLTLLAQSGGDKWLQLVIVALVALSGGGNFFATRSVGDHADRELAQAIREIHEIRDHWDPAVQRQQRMMDKVEAWLSDEHTADINRGLREIHEMRQEQLSQKTK